MQATPWQLQAYTAALASGLSAPKLASQMRLALPAAERVTASILAAFPRLADFQEGVSWPDVLCLLQTLHVSAQLLLAVHVLDRYAGHL